VERERLPKRVRTKGIAADRLAQRLRTIRRQAQRSEPARLDAPALSS
jgi:hypothetical protein